MKRSYQSYPDHFIFVSRNVRNWPEGDSRRAWAIISAIDPKRTVEKVMHLHYLEIVATDVDSVCSAYAAASNLQFGDPQADLGNARTATAQDGYLVGVRAPMHESEEPVVRPYWLVDDIESAVAAAVEVGGEIAHPPLEIPGRGAFAIYVLGDVHHGFWQL